MASTGMQENGGSEAGRGVTEPGGPNALARVSTTLDAINVWTGHIVAFAIFPVTAVLFYEVVARYFFNSPTVWAHDAAQQLMLLIVMLGAAYTLREGAHVSIDALSSHLPPRVQAALDIVFVLILWICSIVIVWYGWSYFWNSWSVRERSPGIWGAPLYPIKFTLPLAGAFLIMEGLPRLLRDIAALRGQPAAARSVE